VFNSSNMATAKTFYAQIVLQHLFSNGQDSLEAECCGLTCLLVRQKQSKASFIENICTSLLARYDNNDVKGIVMGYRSGVHSP